MSWRLHRIVLYSHDGRRHHLPKNGFKASGISTIVGDSNTGKSAILEIVNYCLGSSECEIADFVKRRCNWVGIQLARPNQFALLCRQVPEGARKSADAYFLKTATSDILPAGDELRTMGTGALEKFEHLLGIGALVLEDKATQAGFTVSVRHCSPYCLVRDDVITSRSILFSGARDEKKARHLRDTLPYFLGHVAEEAIRTRHELRRRRAELRSREAEFAQRRLLAQEGSLRLSSFIDKAKSLGLINPSATLENPILQRAALAAVAQFRPASTTAPPSSERHAVDQALLEARRRTLQLQDKRRAVQQTTRDAGAFWSAASGQLGRLQALDLLEEHQDHRECPICRSEFADRAEPISVLRSAMDALQRDIGEVAYDRPRLDAYLLDLDNQIDALKVEQQRLVSRFAELVKLDADIERDRGLDEARLRLAGQVEFYLSTISVEDLSVEEAELERLRGIVTGLESEVAKVNVAEDMQDDVVVLSAAMKDIIAQLPFAAEYRDAIPIFDWKVLQVHLRDGNRKVSMASIGSDENYLAIHIAFFVAIHRLFAARKRPVPQFVIFDQVTRPYFPNSDYKEIVQLPPQTSADTPAQPRRLSDEAAKVRRIFATLFKLAAAPDTPQIIVCEKANFQSDPQYQASIVEFWATPNGMVPGDWQTKD